MSVGVYRPGPFFLSPCSTTAHLRAKLCPSTAHLWSCGLNQKNKRTNPSYRSSIFPAAAPTALRPNRRRLSQILHCACSLSPKSPHRVLTQYSPPPPPEILLPLDLNLARALHPDPACMCILPRRRQEQARALSTSPTKHRWPRFSSFLHQASHLIWADVDWLDNLARGAHGLGCLRWRNSQQACNSMPPPFLPAYFRVYSSAYFRVCGLCSWAAPSTSELDLSWCVLDF